MSNVFTRVILAVLVGIAAGIVCLVLAAVLTSIGVKPAAAIGDVLGQFAWAIGLVVGVWFYLTGRV